MGSHMKTTIDIADALLETSKEVAAREHTTLRSLVEEGLRKTLEAHAMSQKKFTLRPIKFGRGGFQPEFREGDWDRIRDEAYRGRGT